MTLAHEHGPPLPCALFTFGAHPLTTRAPVNTQRSTETTTILQPPPLFSYVVANNCVPHLAFLLLAPLRLSNLGLLRSRRLYGLTIFCFCFEPVHVDFGGLNTTKWRHKSAIIRSRGRAPHHQLQGTPMADPSQP
jgi:hypothetical protein